MVKKIKNQRIACTLTANSSHTHWQQTHHIHTDSKLIAYTLTANSSHAHWQQTHHMHTDSKLITYTLTANSSHTLTANSSHTHWQQTHHTHWQQTHHMHTDSKLITHNDSKLIAYTLTVNRTSSNMNAIIVQRTVEYFTDVNGSSYFIEVNKLLVKTKVCETKLQSIYAYQNNEMCRYFVLCGST